MIREHEAEKDITWCQDKQNRHDREDARKIAMLVIQYGNANRSGVDDADLYDQIVTKLFAMAERQQPASIEAEEHQRDGLAHELWAAAQTVPGEGIEDAVPRVERLLREAVKAAYERAAEIIEQGQETTSCTADETVHRLTPRKPGNQSGLAYAAAIRAMGGRAMRKNDPIAKDNLVTRERELWRDGRITARFGEREIGTMIAENKRIKSTVIVPPFGSLAPYWPTKTGSCDAE